MEERRDCDEGGGPTTTLADPLPSAAAVDADDDDEAFASWCRSVGIWIRPSLQCSSLVDVGGRGVVTLEPIEAGEALVKVPREWVFSLGAALSESDDGGAFRAALLLEREREGPLLSCPEALLACYLLFESWKVDERDERERRKGGGGGTPSSLSPSSSPPPPPPPPRSRWEPYLRSLPRSYPLLMQTVSVLEERESVFRLFAGVPEALGAAEVAAEEAGGAVAEAAASLVASAASRVASGSSSRASAFSRERWAWARATVRSRAMFFSDGDDFSPSPPSSSPPLPSDLTFLRSAGALLPFGDLFNHSHAPAPEEPDTGGTCRTCRGWHASPSSCDDGREGATTTTGERDPSPLSWGDGAFDGSTSRFVVTARKRYEPRKEGEGRGEGQVFLTYSSDASNLSTLRNYGFVDGSNPHDRAPVSLHAWERVLSEVEREEETEKSKSKSLWKGDKKQRNASERRRRWRAEALESLLSSPSPASLSEKDSWFHSLSGAPGWKLLASLRSAFLSTEATSSSSSSSSSLSQRRAAVASGSSPGAAVDAAVFSALADAARVARELASAGDDEQRRIEESRERERGSEDDDKTPSEGLLAALEWRRSWLAAVDRAVEHATRVAGAAELEAGKL